MSEILRRLARLTRAHLYDLWDRHWQRQSADPPPASQRPQAAEPAEGSSSAPSDTHPRRSLPYSDELAGDYGTLDLPFGAPMHQVNKRWKTYLKKCHPDRYANDPEKQADATRLTQELTQAYENIKRAWAYYQPDP